MRLAKEVGVLISRWPMVLGVAILLAGCSGGDAEAEPVGAGVAETIELTSAAFSQGSAIPRQYTCDGPDLSPPLRWSGVPAGARSLALVVDDPDAGGTWVHWVVYGVPGNVSELSEGASSDIGDGLGGIDGTNDFRRTGYGGPCPPDGPAHRYFFTLFAVDNVPELAPGATKSELLGAIEGHVVAQGSLMGTYKRQR